MPQPYYQNKVQILEDLFAKSVTVETDQIRVGDRVYPVVDDVIIILEPWQYPERVRQALGSASVKGAASDFAEDIQFSFGAEWSKFQEVLPDHKELFRQYFDLIDLKTYHDKRVCDMGCGAGRFSYHFEPFCREIVLLDFSEAIFVARNNLRHSDKALFFMADVRKTPFRDLAFDFVFSLGVLHHLPTPALNEVRGLHRLSRDVVIYLYYALDNRPLYFRLLNGLVSIVRQRLAKVRGERFRHFMTHLISLGVYYPLVYLGHMMEVVGKGKYVPLYQGYKNMSGKHIRQDVYDRFFTSIEQRVSRKQILELQDTFREVIVSENLPYWHFRCLG